MKTQLRAHLFILLAIHSALVGVAFAQTNDTYTNSSGSWGQSFLDQWALHQLDIIPSSQDNLFPVTVAVIDTGLDYIHPDMAADNIWKNPREQVNGRDDDGNGYIDDVIGWNFVDGDNNPWDRSGHGTHIAGVIAASTNNGKGIAGINPTAKIMTLKVANFAGNARSSSVAAAIYYAADMGARIINLSLAGFGISKAERDALRYAISRNVLIIAAAGNRATNTQAFGYGSVPEVLTISATDQNNERTPFSNFGVDVQLMAPGTDILSLRARDTDFIDLTQPKGYVAGAAIVGNDKAYYRASGTSFATAVASGVASRMLARKPELASSQLRTKLIQSATDLAAPGVDQLTGYGLINPTAAESWPANRYVEARIRDVAIAFSATEKVVVSVRGDAFADKFKQTTLEIAAAQQPDKWLPLKTTVKGAVENDVIAQIELEDLIALTPGNYDWIMRLVTSHQDGMQRESRFAFTLPVPEAVAKAAQKEQRR